MDPMQALMALGQTVTQQPNMIGQVLQMLMGGAQPPQMAGAQPGGGGQMPMPQAPMPQGMPMDMGGGEPQMPPTDMSAQSAGGPSDEMLMQLVQKGMPGEEDLPGEDDRHPMDRDDTANEWEGGESGEPTKSDFKFMQDNPTDGVLESFEEVFGVTPNVNESYEQFMQRLGATK